MNKLTDTQTHGQTHRTKTGQEMAGINPNNKLIHNIISCENISKGVLTLKKIV